MRIDISLGHLRSSGARSWKKTAVRSLRALREFARRPSWEDPRSFLLLPNDTASIQDIIHRTRPVRQKRPQLLLCIGIGGSSLGARAVFEALQGAPEWSRDRQTRIWWLETIETDQLTAVRSALRHVASPDDVAIVLASKSGATLETLTNASVVLAALHSRWPRKQPRVFVITDGDSQLMQHARQKRWNCFALPSGVSGRFSVLSAVGLVPLALAGIDVGALCRGAAQLTKDCFLQRASNLALRSALTLLAASRTCGIHDTFVFRPHLFALGQWYRQLQGESLGKQIRGKRTTWMTPTTSVGSQDLHSVLQLYLSDMRNRMSTFLFAPAKGPAFPTGTLQGLAGVPAPRRIGTIQAALLASVLRTYRDVRQPFLSVTFAALTPAAIGAFLQWKMIETVLIADALGVNAYTQPQVERYKVHARALLRRP